MAVIVVIRREKIDNNRGELSNTHSKVRCTLRTQQHQHFKRELQHNHKTVPIRNNTSLTVISFAVHLVIRYCRELIPATFMTSPSTPLHPGLPVTPCHTIRSPIHIRHARILPRHIPIREDTKTNDKTAFCVLLSPLSLPVPTQMRGEEVVVKIKEVIKDARTTYRLSPRVSEYHSQQLSAPSTQANNNSTHTFTN